MCIAKFYIYSHICRYTYFVSGGKANNSNLNNGEYRRKVAAFCKNILEREPGGLRRAVEKKWRPIYRETVHFKTPPIKIFHIEGTEA
jgi:hypothetical protein